MNFFRALCALLIIVTSIPLPYNSYAKGQINHQISNAIDPVSYFVNRNHELAQIQLNLKSFKKTSIVGISGMGKTELARMHAKLHKDDYQIIWVIDCHLDLDQEFLRLVKKLNKYRNAGIPENAFD